jgi:hypothetical protein
MATTIRTRIYARGEVSFAKFLFLSSWFAKLLEANFLVLTKLDGCQIDLPRATPTVPHPKLSLLLFWQKQKNLLQQFFILGCHLSQVGKN